MTAQAQQPSFLLCVKNDGYAASLEVRKVYQAIPDATAAGRGYVRVVDESGEDYLYPEEYFVPIELPQAAASAFAQPS
jgi:hypothetical protein